MALDLEEIRKNYANFEDRRIEHIAKKEAFELVPEVIPILIDEIRKRGLNPDLIAGIEVQRKELTDKELNELKVKITKLPCPNCGEQDSLLVGSLIRTVKSFVIITSYKKSSIITCRTCAKKKRKNAIIATVLLGWWGIPSGIFSTPKAIIQTWVDTKKSDKISDEIITNFVFQNIGEIITYWKKESELVECVRHANQHS